MHTHTRLNHCCNIIMRVCYLHLFLSLNSLNQAKEDAEEGSINYLLLI